MTPQGVAIAVFVLIMLASNGLLYAIMRYERRVHPDDWVRDRRPGAAWFFVPRLGQESWIAHWRILRWTFWTPTWARAEATAWRLFFAWRISLLAGVAAFVVLASAVLKLGR